MKYQIYLNKQTSDIINAIAEKEGRRPVSLIKEFMEGFFDVAKAVRETMQDDKRKR